MYVFLYVWACGCVCMCVREITCMRACQAVHGRQLSPVSASALAAPGRPAHASYTLMKMDIEVSCSLCLDTWLGGEIMGH
jgi:hypothetical protein